MRTVIKEVFPVLLGILIPLAAFTTGLRAPRSDQGRLRLWRRPGQLARDLLAILVLVPLWAILLVSILPVSPMVRGGILVAVLAVGIGPAAGMKRMGAAVPNAPEALDLNVIVLLLSLLFVPIAFAAVAALFHRDLDVSVGAVAKVVVGRALLPLVLGLGAARLFPRAAAAAGPVIGLILNLVLLLVIVLAVAATWKLLAEVGGVGWLVAVAAAGGAVIIGHLLGGPDPGSRGVVAAAASMRFPALALVLAHAMPQGRRVIPVVLVYVIVAFVLMTVYGAVVARRQKREANVAPISALPQRA
jgi:bile acid:Na+ symporter, BASS family